MKPTLPEPDDLIDYLYGDAADTTRAAVDRQLDQCEETRSQVAEWKATMALLDTWEVEAPGAPEVSVWQQATPLLKVAAAVAVLLGAGVWIGTQMQSGIQENSQTLASTPDPGEVELAATPTIDHEDVEKHLIMASGAMTHRQVQEHLQSALQELRKNDQRNEALAMFLPPSEQVSYNEGRQAIETVAKDVVRETQRHEDFTSQIIARARARAAAKR